MEIAILGLGYTGEVLASQLITQGHKVLGIARDAARLKGLSSALGTQFEARPADIQTTDDLTKALHGAERVVHLAPPPRDRPVYDDAVYVTRSLWRGCDRLVYGSTTGVYAPPLEADDWVDEDTPTAPGGWLGKNRLTYEQALLDTASAPVYTVRIAGIYGPRRHLLSRIRDHKLRLFKGGPKVSRIHQHDLARILAAMVLHERPPHRIIACDEEPTPTLDVAQYVAKLTGVSLPPLEPESEAALAGSDATKELRLRGKPCRSKYRNDLIGPLVYPTYRDGLNAILEDEEGIASSDS